MAGESQNELKNKEIKLQRWIWQERTKYLINGLMKSHADTLGRWEYQKIKLIKIMRHLNKKMVHHDAKMVGEMYHKLDDKCKKYVYLLLHAPKLVIQEYNEAVQSTMNDEDKKELMKRLGINVDKKQRARKLAAEAVEDQARREQQRINESTRAADIIGDDAVHFEDGDADIDDEGVNFENCDIEADERSFA